MNFDWQLRGQATLGIASAMAERKIARVLLEYDGPQLAVLESRQSKYIAFAADEDDKSVRWIHAPVTELEIKALLRGQIAIRNVVAKSIVSVIDVSLAGKPTLAWPTVSVSEIPGDCLPERDVLLPQFARESAISSGRVAFECEGESVRGHSMLFSCLSALTGSLQRFWSAAAPDAGVEAKSDGEGAWGPAALVCPAGAPGSFAIVIERRDAAAFEAIASVYRSIVSHSYGDPKLLQEALAARRPSLAQAYSGYLSALETFKVDVLFDSGRDITFLGFDAAARVRPYVARSGIRSATGRTSEVFEAIGYFDGFMKLKARFEFFDVTTRMEYRGNVSEPVLALAHARDVVIGRHAPMYAARIETTFGPGNKKRHLLLSVREIPASTDPTLIPVT